MKRWPDEAPTEPLRVRESQEYDDQRLAYPSIRGDVADGAAGRVGVLRGEGLDDDQPFPIGKAAKDAGLLRVGAVATSLLGHGPERTCYDLPSSAPRLVADAYGISSVIVAASRCAATAPRRARCPGPLDEFDPAKL